MDFATAVKIIMRDIEETRAILDEMESTSGAPVNEIELVKAKLRSAMEMLSILPRMSSAPTVSSVSESSVVAPPAPEPTVITKPAPEIKPQESVESIKTELKNEPVPETEKENTTPKEPEAISQPVKKDSGKEQSNTGKTVLADKFGSDGILGEKLSNIKRELDVSTVIASKPISDITTAIGINDRFYYIRELFGNNTEEYYKAISRLNKASSLGEAINILDKSVVTAPDTDAYSAFTDVLKRKFPIQ